MPEEKSDLHPSVQALMAEARKGESAEDIIRRKAWTMVADAKKNNWQGPPYDPELLAEINGIKVKEAQCDIKGSGRIVSIQNQVYIEYAKGQLEGRRRFTICHELAHTFFPDCYRTERLRKKAIDQEKYFERLCDIGAAELLLPKEDFSRDVGKKLITGELVISLSELYQASIDATSWRAVAFATRPTCAVFLIYKKPDPGKKSCLFIKYAISNGKPFPYFKEGIPINSKSVLNEVHSKQTNLKSALENWCIFGRWYKWSVDGIPLPKIDAKDASDVLALLGIS
jgi:Zn-dependent peptidase ImmA (M78 family)